MQLILEVPDGISLPESLSTAALPHLTALTLGQQELEPKHFGEHSESGPRYTQWRGQRQPLRWPEPLAGRPPGPVFPALQRLKLVGFPGVELPPSFALHAALHTIIVDTCALAAVPEPLLALQHLRHVDLSDNRLGGDSLDGLRSASCLTLLDLSGNSLRHLAPGAWLGEAHQLRLLRIGGIHRSNRTGKDPVTGELVTDALLAGSTQDGWLPAADVAALVRSAADTCTRS